MSLLILASGDSIYIDKAYKLTSFFDLVNGHSLFNFISSFDLNTPFIRIYILASDDSRQTGRHTKLTSF